MTTWFGNTTTSGTSNFGPNQPQGQPFTNTATGNITAAHCKIASLSPGVDTPTKILIYAVSAGAPGALLGASDELSIVNGSAMAVRNYTFTTPVAVVSSTSYFLVLFSGNIYNIQLANQAVGTTYYKSGQTYPTPPSPFGTPTGSYGGNQFHIEAGVDPSSTTYNGSATVSLTDTVTTAGKRTTYSTVTVAAAVTVTTAGTAIDTGATLYGAATVTETVTITTHCELPLFDLEPRPVGSLVLNPADPDAFVLTPHPELVR